MSNPLDKMFKNVWDENLDLVVRRLGLGVISEQDKEAYMFPRLL